MGLDIYVGSYTRYYSRDWETVVQAYGRQQGLPVTIVRTNEPLDAITDPAQIRPAVLAWRDQLSAGLGQNIDSPLDWNESAAAPYFTDKPGWDAFGALLMWAAYAEQRDLQRPAQMPASWADDPAYNRSTTANRSIFPQLLGGVETWLPVPFSFTFRAQDPGGADVTFGSSVQLLTELEELNRATWNASPQELLGSALDGTEGATSLSVLAKFGFSIMSRLTRGAVEHRLIMRLDY